MGPSDAGPSRFWLPQAGGKVNGGSRSRAPQGPACAAPPLRPLPPRVGDGIKFSKTQVVAAEAAATWSPSGVALERLPTPVQQLLQTQGAVVSQFMLVRQQTTAP